MSAGTTSRRILSMDQFRGYTVAGMFLVNFVGGFAAISAVLKHNNTWFSYADSIMPSFMFAVGFSFRLTYLRRREQMSARRTMWTYMRRSLALVVISLVMYGFGEDFRKWGEFKEMPFEFQPFRQMAPRGTSFGFLMSKVAAASPGADERAIIERSAKIGEAAAADEPKKEEEKPAYRLAQEASQKAIDEVSSLVPAAEAREKAWGALDWKVQLATHWCILGTKLIKSNLWETLAIIGITQLVVLPWIGCGFGVRFAVLIAMGAIHCAISYWFNWDFVYAVNNTWLSKALMTGESRSWDGGLFGPLSWGIAMMAGTLAYDIMTASVTSPRAAGRLFLWGVGFMAVGYVLSCLTRLYELNGEELDKARVERLEQGAEKGFLSHVIERQQKQIGALRKPFDDLQGPINDQKNADFKTVYKELAEKPEYKGLSVRALADLAAKEQKANPRPNAKRNELEAAAKKIKNEIQPKVDRLQAEILALNDQLKGYPNLELAKSPVAPPWSRIKGRSLNDLLAQPPFVAPPRDEPRIDPGPHIDHRLLNYWMMGKRMPDLPFMAFSTGFAFALYGVFVVLCDVIGLRLGIFRTFGTNALAAYFLHHVVAMAVEPLVPRDAQLWYCIAGFAFFFLLTYWCVRFLEKRNIFLKL